MHTKLARNTQGRSLRLDTPLTASSSLALLGSRHRCQKEVDSGVMLSRLGGAPLDVFSRVATYWCPPSINHCLPEVITQHNVVWKQRRMELVNHIRALPLEYMASLKDCAPNAHAPGFANAHREGALCRSFQVL
eukprot:1896176-Amphidinium_carterae.1